MADKKTIPDAPPYPPPPNGSNGNPAVDFSGRYLEIKNFRYLCTHNGGLAQLARALAWHARGHQFDPGILHNPGKDGHKSILIFIGIHPPASTDAPSILQQQPGAGKARHHTGADKPAGGAACDKKTAIGRKKNAITSNTGQ